METSNEMLQIRFVAELVYEQSKDNQDIQTLSRLVATLWELYLLSDNDDIFHWHNIVKILELEQMLKEYE